MQSSRALVILTGASRGLGLAMAEQLMTEHALLLTISRQPDPALQTFAAAPGAQLEQWSIDLAEGASAAARLEAWLKDKKATSSSATLINNAALAGPAGPIDQSTADELAGVLRVGSKHRCCSLAHFCGRLGLGRRAQVLNFHPELEGSL